MFFGGIVSFFTLGQLEDPVFTIKSATISTKYPGASPEEVELEVTDRLELAIQELTQLKRIYSTSSAGKSTIKVDIKDQYWSDKLPQIWDELRKKIRDAAKDLPPGVEAPVVSDDFGFVYGFLLALTGDGFSPREVEYYADALKKELSLIEGVSRVDLWGVQPQVIYVDFSEQKLTELGVSGATMVDTLSKQNMVVDAGGSELSTNRMRIAPTGEFRHPEEIGELMIRPSSMDTFSQLVSPSGRLMGPRQLGPQAIEELTAQGETGSGAGTSDFIKLKDLATIRRGYLEPPQTMMRYNQQPAIAIQIAGADDANIVHVGRRIDERLKELKALLPVGVEFHKIAWQSDIVDESIQSFLVNLVEAVLIVLAVLIIPSGLRMGFIIGFDLIITILATFIFMAVYDIPLQRMSLGALIIAMGMMVDNAIVVSDSIAVKIRQGMDRVEAAVESAASSAYPLFAATIVAVLAFFPIYLSTAGAGEYCNTLFLVVAAALLISWLVAMIITPLQCIDFLSEPESSQGETGKKDEFDTPFYNRFRNILAKLIRMRFLTIGIMGGLLLISIFCFGFVKQMFFPDSSRPQMMIDYWAPEGTRVQQVSEDIKGLEEKFLASPLTNSITTFIGAGPPRFYLPVDPEGLSQNYAQVIVNFPDYRNVDPFIEELKPWAEKNFPQAMIRFRKYAVGTANTWKFEAKFSGPATADLQILRDLGDKALSIAETSPFGTDWRIDMMNRDMKIVPVFDQKRARLISITRDDIARTTRRGFDGIRMGLYRERDKLLPIIVRSVKEERDQFFNRIDVLQVQPVFTTKTIPLAQAVSDIKVEWEDPIIARFNRRRAITVQGGPKLGMTFPTLKANVGDKIEDIELPPGYELFWDGETFSTKEAQESLIPGVIPSVVLIVFLIITIFNSYRPLIIILLTIPFAAIGITWGLLLLQTPFGFLALLGAMSLAGMMNKNIVLLLDACSENVASGMDRYNAIISASVTRVRPVLLAAGTTVLGVIPLVTDVFWTAMAVTIMAGLAFGSLLTLVVVPVLYSILYKLKSPKKDQEGDDDATAS
ncbi:MAG: Multidrug export protein AcrF [Chlamydiae bacterium]|nr:Multidrug export protein AcrF [Chlamydiota bacterium]